MDFILRNLERRIELLAAQNKKADLRVHYQAKYEYMLVLAMSYLWNKNFDSLGANEKEYISAAIVKPSIGSIVEIARKLDIHNELFSNKKLQKSFDKYPSLRNEKLGHGFTFEDETDELLGSFDELYQGLLESGVFIFCEKLELINVIDIDSDNSTGIIYKPNGADYLPWSCPKGVYGFDKIGLYGFTESKGYFRLSPFVFINDEDEFYIYSSIQEKLSGLARFNRLIKTGHILKEVKEFVNIVIDFDDKKRRCSNGTVLNNFTKNYKKYIETGVKRKINKFLVSNKSSVFATVWGHGGVGKTASIQSVCEDLGNVENKKFNYIVFLSAKDRLYNYYQGTINEIDERVSSLEDIILYTNEIMFSKSSSEALDIIDFDGQLLLVIDDFETFSPEEKGKILDFIKLLNINHHKVIITTRAATLILGEEIKSNELDEQEMIKFLLEVIEIEAPLVNIAQIQHYLEKDSNYKKVHEMTSGRPLFIFQFAVLLAQKALADEVINIDIKSSSNAVKFLYDRIYDYLSPVAQHLFVAMCLLVSSDDLTNVVEKLQYLVNMEDQQDDFDNGINELVKLKIIEIFEQKFFRVYSREILKFMNEYFQQNIPQEKEKLTYRLSLVGRDKKLDNDHALLINADSSRITATEGEVVSKYRYIVNREQTSYSIKLQALLNLGTYLFSTKNDAEGALRLFADYKQIFENDIKFTKAYVQYLWSADIDDSRDTAIKLIKWYFWTKNELSDDMRLQLNSMLVMYESIEVVNSRENLKEEKRFDMISIEEYNEKYTQQKIVMNSIVAKAGSRLVEVLNSDQILELSSATRTLVLAGLVQLVEVYIRLNRNTQARAICNKVIAVLPQNFHQPFKSKLKKLDMYERVTVSRRNDSDFASTLKNALKKEED
ncbi:NB-ARC domain-containing protein [Hymenobacter sp. DH14]|uniref:NB-ARC domain-containing protein n=1 Tax=Hymenobacter cyanobacteriorum TaxID=2926463 RepID=A0A9X1VCI8_9BACT|nr:NB-ARC domain-containing protein [Hymenobacter cyanobacteriorum]MCI1186222.1 NB-ARC domain-containing protein [Hymenobacter cyanobacteriorum]